MNIFGFNGTENVLSERWYLSQTVKKCENQKPSSPWAVCKVCELFWIATQVIPFPWKPCRQVQLF